MLVCRNIIVAQSVWENIKKSSPPVYKAMYSLCYESEQRKCFVFMDDFHKDTHVIGTPGESVEQRYHLLNYVQHPALRSTKFRYLGSHVTPSFVLTDWRGRC